MISKWLTLLTVLSGLTPAAVHAQTVCAQCGQAACATQPATVTDWQTNERHAVGCVKCALDMMAARYPWSRASFTTPDYPDPVTLTRAQGRWSTKPETAVVVVSAEGGGCGGVQVFASREGYTEYARKHPREVKAANRPVLLSDYAAKVAPAPAPTPMAVPKQAPRASMAAPAPRAVSSEDPNWVAGAVQRVRSAGLMTGDPDGGFRGRDSLTRYELAQTINRVVERLAETAARRGAADRGEGLRAHAVETPRVGPLDLSSPPQATRVSLLVQPQPQPAEVLSAAADALTQEGLRPEVVREAVALVPTLTASRPVKTAALASDSKAPDVPPDHWAYEAVERVLGAGLMEGYPDGTFHGDGEVTRYEIAMVLSRMVERYPVLAQAPAGGAARSAGKRWTCPMHPEVVSDKPGECPKCGMDLVAEQPADAGGAAAKQYTCPMHPDVVSDKPGECPKCGMDLIEKTPAEPAPDAAATGDASAGPAQASETAKLRDLAQRLEKQMREAGLSEEQITRALAPVNAEIEARGKSTAKSAEAQRQMAALAAARNTLAQLEAELAATDAGGIANRQPPKEPTGESQVSFRAASEDASLPFEPEEWRDQSTFLGPTGLVLAPTADIQPLGQVHAGFGRFNGSNVTFGTAGFTDRLEAGASLTTGALPSRLVPHAKYQVWNSETFDARLAVGLIDPLDDIDTTFYGVFTKDFSLKLGASRPRLVSLSAGLGGGMLLDGFFGGVNVPLSDKLSLQTEVVDFGGDSIWNAGLDYEILSDLRAKVASVDGHLSGGVAYETSF